MKKKALSITLFVTALLSSLAVFIKISFSEIFGKLICFPFEQIGLGLRRMSLQGGLQNAIALIIYITLCLSPIVLFLLLSKKNATKAEDGLLIVLSLVLFYVIYLMINPGLIPMPNLFSTGKVILCGTVYSIIVTYLILRIIRLFFHSDNKSLYSYMVILLWITAILFVLSIFGTGVETTINKIESIKEANIGTESGLGTTYIFVVINFIISSIPSLVSVFVIFSGINLIKEFSVDAYSESAIKVAKELARVCIMGLIITACSNLAFNLLQLLFMSSLRNVSSLIQIPLFSVVFLLGTLIFSRMIIANKVLKDDNDSII